MLTERLNHLHADLQTQEVDCLAVIPGPNLLYLTGVKVHLMERAVIGFFPAKGAPVFLLPSLETERIQEALPYEARFFPYFDADGPASAAQQAAAAVPALARLAVEYLQMRVQELTLIEEHLPHATIVNAQPIMDALRLRKNGDEIEAMQQAIAITERALHRVIEGVQPGMTEREIASQLTIALLEEGSGAAPFEPIVLSGPRSALPHGEPTDRPIDRGDLLLIDFGASRDGYISDITRTFIVGQPPGAKLLNIYQAVKEANSAGRLAAGPGVPCEEVDRAARRVIEEWGYGDYFIHRTGHGIGLEAHEGPYIVKGNQSRLEPGMTFTVEPGIYIPNLGGVRFEDDVWITEDSVVSLTEYERDLLIIGAPEPDDD